MAGKDLRLEMAMGNMLRIGVTAAALVVLLGGALYLIGAHGAAPDYRHFHAAAFGGSLGAILAGVAHFKSESLIELGMLMLIATPVCRVILGLVGFTLLKDRFYTAVSAIVLAVLLFSFFGKH